MQKIPKQEYTAEFKEQAVTRAREVGIGVTHENPRYQVYAVPHRNASSLFRSPAVGAKPESVRCADSAGDDANAELRGLGSRPEHARLQLDSLWF